MNAYIWLTKVIADPLCHWRSGRILSPIFHEISIDMSAGDKKKRSKDVQRAYLLFYLMQFHIKSHLLPDKTVCLSSTRNI